jgi:hypothetical protein
MCRWPRTLSQENRTSENAFVNVCCSRSRSQFPHYLASAGGVKRTNKNQHGGQEGTSSARSGTGSPIDNTPVRPCFQGYHSRIHPCCLFPGHGPHHLADVLFPLVAHNCGTNSPTVCDHRHQSSRPGRG